MAIQDDIPIRSNSERVEASWWNVIRQALVTYNIGVHESLTNNPHSVTKTQVGLSNVPNVDATARANHTGTQLAATISDLATAIPALVGLNYYNLTGDLTNNSTVTLTNMTSMQFPVVAGKTYEIYMAFIYQSTSALSGMVLGLNTIDTAAGRLAQTSSTPVNADGTNAEYVGANSSLGDLVAASGVPVINTDYMLKSWGIFKCTVSGILVPQFRIDSGTGTVTVYAGSTASVRGY